MFEGDSAPTQRFEQCALYETRIRCVSDLTTWFHLSLGARARTTFCPNLFVQYLHICSGGAFTYLAWVPIQDPAQPEGGWSGLPSVSDIAAACTICKGVEWTPQCV